MRQRYPNFRRAQRKRGPFAKHGERKQHSFAKQLLAAAAAVAGFTWIAAPQIQSIWSSATRSPDEVAAAEARAYYANCNHARAAGAAPIHRGQPGYREALDRDGDGTACEPYQGR